MSLVILFSTAFLSLCNLSYSLSTPFVLSTQDAPTLNLPLTKYLNATNSSIADEDRARSYAMFSAAKNRSWGGLRKRQSSIPATNAVAIYTAAVQIGSGSSAATYDLIVDTGSANTWIRNDVGYQQGTSCVNSFNVNYGSGQSVSGTECE